jgi:predicted transcriptional regulator
MLRVRDIMTADVVTLDPDQTLREAIDTLVTCRIQGAPVVDGDKVVGVLSAPDILEFESVTPVEAEREEEEEEEEEADTDAPEEWQEGEELSSSYFTDLWSDRGSDVSERMAAHGASSDLLSDHLVAEAMSRTICTVPASMEVSNAAQRMLAAGVQRALVTDDDTFVGILSTTDIIRAVAAHRLTVRQMVFDR